MENLIRLRYVVILIMLSRLLICFYQSMEPQSMVQQNGRNYPPSYNRGWLFLAFQLVLHRYLFSCTFIKVNRLITRILDGWMTNTHVLDGWITKCPCCWSWLLSLIGAHTVVVSVTLFKQRKDGCISRILDWMCWKKHSTKCNLVYIHFSIYTLTCLV